MKRRVKACQAGALLLGVMCILPFTGCGKETPQSLAKSMAANLGKVESVEMSVKLDFSAVIDMSGISDELGEMEMSMGMDTDMETTLDPAAAYAKGTVSMSIMGQEETQETESYTVIEDGEMVTYTLANGQWMKSVSEEADSDMLNLSLYEAIADGDLEVEMDEDFASVNDKDAYVLRVNLSGDDLKDFIDTSMDSTGMLDDDEIDWDDIKAKLKVYVYKDTKMPAKVKLDCKDLGSAMMDASMGSSGGAVEVKKFDLELIFNDYDSVKKIKVPDEAKETATDEDYSGILDGLDDEANDLNDGKSGTDGQQPGDTGNTGSAEDDELKPDADGNYTINSDEGGHAAVITLMDGQEFSYASDGYLSSMSTDYSKPSVDITYNFVEYYSLDEMAEDATDCSWMGDYKEYANVTPGQVQEMTVNGMTVYWAKNTYDYDSGYGATHFEEYKGWVQTGDILFSIEVETYGSDGSQMTVSEKTLEEAFQKVKVS